MSPGGDRSGDLGRLRLPTLERAGQIVIDGNPALTDKTRPGVERWPRFRREHTMVDMRLIVATMILVTACSDNHKSAARDAAVADTAVTDVALPPDARATDGMYTCVTQQFAGDSCDAPLFDTSIQAQWTLALAGGAVTITSIGFDTPTIGCTGGTWSGTDFMCTGSWTRAGRACNLSLHLREQPAGTLTFWVGTNASDIALCTRS